MRLDGNKIRCLMCDKQIGMVRLAECCHMQHKTLKRAVEGQRVSFVTAGKISHFFEVSPEELIKNDSEDTWR